MAEAGMEMPKIGLKQRVVEAFTPRGAKEKWYREHAEIVKKYADVHNGLTDEQRAQVMADFEATATKTANVNVLKWWGGTAVTLGTLAFGGGLIKSERFRNWVGKGHIGKWEFGKGFQKFGEKGAEVAEKASANLSEYGGRAKQFLKDLGNRLAFWRKEATVTTPSPTATPAAT